MSRLFSFVFVLCKHGHFIYENLIVPSIQLIEQNKKSEAVNYYSSFVNMMKSEYLS
ncbi:hypothetical protein [Sphingobacterium sp. LRF_L2]|uniref:hypothetical protein n=1 Tax=Sphingobacterium sp. LRF_L2 TaxID=3369421 RepID=UPI003F62D98B